jgi:hypothetical protein
MKRFILIIGIISFFAVVANEKDKAGIEIEIKENAKVSLKNFTIDFTVKNNTNRDILFNPDYIKKISLDQPSSEGIHYKKVAYELNYNNTGLVSIPSKSSFKFIRELDYVASDFTKHNRKKKMEGLYFISIFYEIEDKLYSTGIKQIYLTY